MGLTADNCTFENPCGPTDLTDVGTATLSGLFPNTAIFFEGGSFDALDVVNGTNPVTIRAGQSLNAAPGSPPSTLNGGLILEGNNALNDIILVPTVATATGEGVSASAGSVVINNSQIGSMANPFTTGLAFSGNTQANLNNSTVFASANGVILADSATLTVDPSVINVNGGDNLVGIDSSSSGALNITNGSSVNVTGGNGVIGVNFTGDGNFDLSDASFINVTGTNGSFGLSTAGVGTVTVSGASSITLTTTGGANSFGYRYAGSGAVNFSAESSLNVNGTGPNLVQGFADLPFASGNVTFDASSINVTNNGAAVGILSQGTGNLNIINESTLNVTGGDQSIGINVIGDQVINMTDSQVVVTGGIFSFGLFSSGTGNISLNGSTLNFTGEDFSTGLSSEGDGNISLNGSAFNVTGGLFSTGLLSEGDGNISINGSTFNFFGLDDCIGFDKNQGDGAVNVSDGSVINVTAGENAITAQFGGNGAVNFSEGSSVILNAAGHSNAIGIFILPGATSTLTLDGTQIIVFGGSNAQGINVSANTSVNLVNQSFVDVNGTGPGSTIGINNANGTVTGDSINVIVTSDDGQALGLATQNAATITLDSSSFDVSGGDLSSAISQASGGLITLTNSTCVLNGVLVTC